MGHRAALIALATVTLVGLLGCGGSRGTSPSGAHTYVYVPFGQSVYVTLVSPVAIPARKLRNKGIKVVAQAKGPRDCSITKSIQGGHGRNAYLNGKMLTVKVNGSDPVTQNLCEVFTTERFVPAFIGK
jgi:hypothetical protein